VRLSLIALALWAAGSALNAALVFVLLYKRRWKTVPWFTVWMIFQLTFAAACFVVYRVGSKGTYRWTYWLGALLDFLLQIAVVLEITACVMKRGGEWIEGAKSTLLPFAIGGPVIAAAFAATMTPATPNLLYSLYARASLFTTILICFLFAAVVRGSQRLGLDWRSHIARESYGLTLWTTAAFITDTLHSYWRTLEHFQTLEHVRIVFFQASLLYWCIAFWIPEPEPKPIPEEIRKALQAKSQTQRTA
jgi:hypothetical protein